MPKQLHTYDFLNGVMLKVLGLVIFCVFTSLCGAQVTFDNAPADESVLCQYIPGVPAVNASSTCPGAVNVDFSETEISRSCLHTYTLARTWTARDGCNNIATHTQRLTIEDNQAPILTGIPSNRTVDPANIPPEPNVGAFDFCDPDARLSTIRDSLAGPCGGYSIRYRFIGTDTCGNTRQAEYVLTVGDGAPPVINGVTPGRRLACGEDLPAPPAVTATDDAGTPSLNVIRDTLWNRGGDTCMIVRRVWTATDACGLSTTAAQQFTLHDDTAPQLFGIPADTVIYCEALPAVPVLYTDITGTDDCAATVSILFEEISGRTADGTCTDVTYETIRRWTAVDECGNSTVREQILLMKCECCDNGIDDDDDGLIDDYDPQCNCFAGVASTCDSMKTYFIPPVWHPNRSVYNQPSELVISTLANEAVVNIQTGDGSTYSNTIVVQRGSPYVLDLTVEQLQTPNYNTIEADRGFVITSDQLIQPIYRIDAYFNKVLVTVKGTQAMGRVFRAGSQTSTCGVNNMPNGEGHFISVMATEDDTEVTFDYDFPALGGIVGPHVIRLNQYETYLIRDDANNTTVSGSLVTSTKPIVVMSGSQHTKGCNYNSNGTISTVVTAGMDGGIDQLVPACLTGDEYVLVRGKGNQTQQYAILVANKNNTRVTVDGDAANEIVLNAGEHRQVWLTGNAYQPRHFRANKPFYMYHVSGISSNNEVGMAIAAPVGACKGDTIINFPRFAAQNATSFVDNSVYVIIPRDGLSSLEINGAPYSSCATDQAVPSLPNYAVVTFESGCLATDNSIRSNSFFTAGMLVGISGETGTHGYLTAFKDRMAVYNPTSGDVTTSYFVDTLCGNQTVNHCINVSSCATTHTIAAIRGGAGTAVITGGSCFDYTSPESFQGEDEILVTLQNNQGLFQTVCLRYYICAEPPTVTFPFLDTLVNCNQIPPLDTPSLSDECNMNVFFDTEETTVSGACDYAYVITRLWTIWDDCGDSTQATQTIRVVDTIPPQAIDVPSDTLISACNGIPPVPTVNFEENCDNSFQWSFRQETVDSNCIYDRTIVRTWEAWDNCGNTSSAIQRIELRDTLAPDIVGVLGDLVATCTDDIGLPLVSVMDNCDPNPSLQLDSTVYNTTCDTLYHVLRVWTSSDACGLTSTVSQRVVVLDITPPQVFNMPADTAIVCGEPLPTEVPTFTDDCTTPVPVYMVDSTAVGVCPVLSTVYRRWTATDACGHETVAEQIIEIIDTVGPVIVALPDTIFSSCLDSVVVLEPSVLEACNLTLNFTDSMAAGANCSSERYLYRSYVATDNCGRQAEYTQLYYFQDIVSPFWVSEPRDTLLNCDDPIPAIIDPNVADACSGLNPIAVVLSDSMRVCPARRWLFRTYTVSDWCGNLSTFTHTIIIDGCEPAIPALASAQADCEGNDIVLQAQVDSGYTTPVYQWQFSADSTIWSNLAQPNDSTSLTFPMADLGDAGYYRVVVADNIADLSIEDCSSVSPAVQLTLKPRKTSLAQIDLCRGDTLFYLGDTLTVSQSRTDTLYTTFGCDSVATLDLNVFPFVDVILDTTLCFGESLDIFGVTYNTSGTYRDTLITTYGCDTTVTLNLVVLNNYRDTSYHALCTGDTIRLLNINYSSAGTYTIPFTSITGCDSSRTLVVFDAQPAATRIDTIVCAGETVIVAGETFDTQGKYSRTLRTSNGCDSVITLYLSVQDIAPQDLAVSLCEGDEYFLGTQRITTAGNYSETFTSYIGCDSVINLSISLVTAQETEIREELCDGEIYVNQNYSFSAAGRWPMQFYTNQGCDSTVYVTLVYRRHRATTFDTILCAGSSIQLLDTVITTPGNYVRTGASYFGCDSTVTLNLRYQDLQFSSIDTTLCFGESLKVGTQEYTQSAQDTIVIADHIGCDSTIYLNLLVRPLNAQDTTALICEGDAFITGSRSYATTGVYGYDTTDINGCDSSYTVYLTVIPSSRDTLNQSICQGDTLTLDGVAFYTAGSFDHVLASALGCDSIVQVNLTIRDTSSVAYDEIICFGESHQLGDTTLTTSGSYQRVLSNLEGCDSTVTVSLLVREQLYTQLDTSICEGSEFNFGVLVVTGSGTYIDTLTSTTGCDSIVELSVVTIPQINTSSQLNICDGDSVVIGGVNYYESGLYSDTLVAVGGCDSIHTTELSVLAPITRDLEITLCEGSSYLLDGVQLTETGNYTATFISAQGCDSVVNVQLEIVDGLDFTVNDLKLCRGESGTLTVTGYDGPIRWTPSNGLSCATCTETEVLAEETTVYTATAIDCYGDSIQAQSLVTIDLPVKVSIVSAEKIRLGERTTLVGVANNPAATLAWSEGDLLLCDNCSEVEVMPITTTTYEVKASTTEGCNDRARLTLIVEDECSFGEILVPNIMTPNNDGANDMLEIRYEGIQEIVLLRIFNRWGELVYETRDIDTYWDGTHHGQPVNPGVFMYYLKGYCLNNEEFTRQGNVTVVR